MILNRPWPQPFGHPLSRTPSDFGLLGHLAPHTAPLDLLAPELGPSVVIESLEVADDVIVQVMVGADGDAMVLWLEEPIEDGEGGPL